MLWLLCLWLVCVLCGSGVDAKPNVVIIIADDMGFNDVGFRGSNQIPTPNIDALAYSGVLLQNFYVTPICTPSRAALMTGKYPIHTGMQHSVIYDTEPRALPLSEKLMPQYFKDLGYKTHLIGKWHLGHYKKEYLPLNRGFDTHLGHWTGKIDLYDHTNMVNGVWGHDFRRGFEEADDLYGQYATDIYTNEAVRLIESHNKSEPLFLMVCHSAVHSGNPYEVIRAPDEVISKFSYIQIYQRQKYAAMMSKMDESVGKVVQSLQNQGLLEDTIILFSSDNGGAAAGVDDNGASNFPLKGVKNTLWEGGVRAAAVLWSTRLVHSARAAVQRMHLVDLLPTLYSAVGGNVSVFNNLDGLDLWQAVSEDLPSNRTSIVHNIDDIWGSAAITVGKWKLHKGANYGGAWNATYGPSGRAGTYDIYSVYKSDAGVALSNIGKMPSKDKILSLREEATLKCNVNIPIVPCEPLKAPCIYDIDADPCERQNMAELFPEILQTMMTELDRVNKTAVPPNNKDPDPKGDPKYWGRAFTTFGDIPPI